MKVPLGYAYAATYAGIRQVEKDDLALIEGIGPKIAEAFNKAGIVNFKQLSTTPVERLRHLLAQAGYAADPESWPEQARLAAEGKMDELKKLQDALVKQKTASLTAGQIKGWQGYFVKDPVSGETMWNNQPGDYDGYNERFGGLAALREAIRDYKKRGVFVTLYTDPLRVDMNSKCGREWGKLWGVIQPDGKYREDYDAWRMCHDVAEYRRWVAETMTESLPGSLRVRRRTPAGPAAFSASDTFARAPDRRAASVTVLNTPQPRGTPTSTHAMKTRPQFPAGALETGDPAAADAVFASLLSVNSAGETGRTARLQRKPRARKPTRMYSVTEYGMCASRMPFTRNGPRMPAVDHAVSTRPWIAPTFATPKRSAR